MMKRLTIAAAVLALVAIDVCAAQAAGPPEASPESAKTGGTVVARHVNADGSGWVQIYQVAANATPAELYASLKASGVPGLVDPTKPSAGLMDPGQCYYGTAFAVPGGICPPVTWNRAGRTRPLVYFRDFTGPLWPVHHAAGEWNRSVVIDSVWTSGQCPNNVHCVPVYETRTHEDYCGQARLAWDSARYFIDGRVSIVFNNQKFESGGCPGGRRATACHELGHALGVDHNASTSSCMYRASVSGKSDRPNSDDFALLEYVSYRR